MVYISKDNETKEIMKKYPYIRKLFNKAHGKGINGEWSAQEFPVNIHLYNTFDTYDPDVGMVNMAVHFFIEIPKKNPLNFKVQWRDSHSEFWANTAGLPNYLEDLFYGIIAKTLNKNPRKMRAPPTKKSLLDVLSRTKPRSKQKF